MSSGFQRKHLVWLLLLLAMGGGVMMTRSKVHPFLNVNAPIQSGQIVTGSITSGTQLG
jgi:hypothetical protein